VSTAIEAARAAHETQPGHALLSSRRVLGIAGVLIVLAVWQVAALFSNRLFLASPLEMLGAIPEVLGEGGLAASYAQTMGLFALSFAFSIAAGLGVGLATALNRRLQLLAEPLLVMLYATPSIVLIPLFILWFGIGDLPKAALVFLATFFPVVINTQLGVRELGPEMRELGRAFGATRREQIVKIIVPSIIPHVATAVRIATPRAFVALLVGEMLISVGGLGSLVVHYSRAFRTDAYFLTIAVIVLTSMALSAATRRLEHMMSPWRADRAAG
jgi:NitT/TauT family transport system permease protein